MILIKHLCGFTFRSLIACLVVAALAVLPALLLQLFKGAPLHCPSLQETWDAYCVPTSSLTIEERGPHALLCFLGSMSAMALVYLTPRSIRVRYKAYQAERDAVSADALIKAMNNEKLSALSQLLKKSEDKTRDIAAAVKVFKRYGQSASLFVEGLRLLLEEIEREQDKELPLPLAGTWSPTTNSNRLYFLKCKVKEIIRSVELNGMIPTS